MNENYFIESTTHPLRLTHFKPEEGGLAELERKLVIMLHDFPGDSTLYNNLFEDIAFALENDGYHSLCFDFSGCGKSDGQSQSLDLQTIKADIETVKNWAINKGYKEFTFLSCGMASLFAMFSMDLDIRSQIMLWPCFDTQKTINQKFETHKINDKDKKAGFFDYNGTNVSLQLIDKLLTVDMKPVFNDMTMPILIFHGTDDHVYPISELDILRKSTNASQTEIMTFHDGEHSLPLAEHREAMFTQIIRFLDKNA